MCFLLLLFVTVFSDSANTTRRFISRNPNYSGDWELGGNAEVVDGILQFPEDLRFGDGYAWLTQRLPSEKWRCRVTMNLTSIGPNNFGKVGIWLTKDFGTTGEIFGGPSKFYGFAILVMIVENKIDIETRENDGHEEFKGNEFAPKFNCTLKNPVVDFEIEYQSPVLRVNVTADQNEYVVFHEKPRVKVRRHWFSISSNSITRKEPILVNSVLFSGNKVPQTQEMINTRKNQTLPILSSLYHQVKENKSDIHILEMIQCLDEVLELSSSLSSADEVLEVVSDKILSFSDKWQRRSINLTNKVFDLRMNIKSRLMDAEDAFNALLGDLQMDILNFQDEIQKIESDMYFQVLEGYSLSKSIKQEKKDVKKSFLPRCLMYTSIIEIIIVVLLSIFYPRRYLYR